VPASTLESKIKALKIDKRRFKPGSASANPAFEPAHQTPGLDRGSRTDTAA
jgi:hypothetical protein